MQTYIFQLALLSLAAAATFLFETQPESSSLVKRGLGSRKGGGRIYGGKYVKSKDIPFQVYVRTFLDDDHVEFCGGSIIGNRHVLTAAHCINMSKVSKVCAIVGHENRFHKQTLKFTVIRAHMYHKKPYERVTGDIAVLLIDRPMPVGRANIHQIRLIGNVLVKDNTTCSISGWGETDDETSDPNLLQYAKVPLVPSSICRKAYPNSPPDDLLCAGFYGTGGVDTCKGDSGGPLVCNGLLTGIVKSGKGCGLPEYPGTYTDVRYYWSWIKKTMATDLSRLKKKMYGEYITKPVNKC